jgi:hypothetical protein
MKFSTCLAAALLALSFSAHAQTSQTFHFGEGQSGMSQGNAPQPAPKPAAHKPKHHTRHHGHATQPHTDSHN